MEEFLKIFSIVLVLIAIVLCFDFRFNRFAKINKRFYDINRKIEDLDRTLDVLNNQMSKYAKRQNERNDEIRQVIQTVMEESSAATKIAANRNLAKKKR